MLIFSGLFTSQVYAQQTAPNIQKSPTTASSATTSAAKLYAVKILSPTKGEQVPIAKSLTIYGTSIDNLTSSCQVVIGVNQVKPYQSTAPIGSGGANDYSKWNFILTSKYTTIKAGSNNKITAKYTCTNNPSLVSYSSVNVTGVAAGKNNTTVPQQKPIQPNITKIPTITAISTTKQENSSSSPSVPNNNTALQNNTSSKSPAPSSSTITSPSIKLVYLASSQMPGKGETTKLSTYKTSSHNDMGATTTTAKTKIHHSKSTSTITTNQPASDNSKVLKSFNNKFSGNAKKSSSSFSPFFPTIGY
jgi:hypothetical protein